MLTILNKWTKEIILGLYFLGIIVCVNYIDQMDKRNNLGLYFLGTIVCVIYIDQMDKRNNFRFLLSREHCVR